MRYVPTTNEKKFFQVISLLENESEAKNFLRDLLTESEIEEFSNRWQVAQMLDQKVPYKEIEKQTRMSSTTIARIQKWLTSGMNGYKTMIQKINNNNSAAHHSLS